MSKNNLELWKKVEKTNPNYTKVANVKGNKITSIAPQFQIKNATEHFGIYGVTWGFKDVEIDYTLVPVCGMVYWKAIFFFPNGEFPATNSISIWRDGAMTKPDDQFAKKVETDSLTKCLSKLGFNADVFLGLFDDVRYVNDMKQEFKPKPKPVEKVKITKEAYQKAVDLLGKKEVTLDQIKSKYLLSPEQEETLNKL